MKSIKASLLTILIMSSVYNVNAWSMGHGGGHFGGGFHGGYGGGYGYRGIGGAYVGIYASPYFYGNPYAYGYPYYNSSPTIIAPSTPTYIEQNTVIEDKSENPSGFWYYCTNPEGYYPYVKECSTEWQKVNPVPPNAH